jgi:hypothetical protein
MSEVKERKKVPSVEGAITRWLSTDWWLPSATRRRDRCASAGDDGMTRVKTLRPGRVEEATPTGEETSPSRLALLAGTAQWTLQLVIRVPSGCCVHCVP